MLDWIAGTLASSGYLGIVVLMFLENLFPPIPSEFIMPLAGFAAARGELDLSLVIAAGMIGSLLGAIPWYGLGRWLGGQRLEGLAARHGRWLTVSSRDVRKASHWFDRHGGKAVFLGRLVPAVRTLISAPAGMARMRPSRFLFYSTIGTLLWTGLLATAGYVLEDQYARVAIYVDPIARAVLGLLVLVYLWRLVAWRDG